MAAAILEQEMGWRSVAAAIRPIKDRAVASSLSVTEPITQKMVAEACDTLIREKHPASSPVWPEGNESPTQSDQDQPRGTGILQEPPLPRHKTASTPRPERGGSPMGAEQGPEPAMFSPSPVVRQEKPSSLRTHVPETEESGSNTGGEPEDRRGLKEEPPHLVARPTSDQDGEEAMGAEPSAHLELAILNGLDISSLTALCDLSTGASATVNIPWPPTRMERATPEWRQKASQAMALLLRGRSGEHYGNCHCHILGSSQHQSWQFLSSLLPFLQTTTHTRIISTVDRTASTAVDVSVASVSGQMTVFFLWVWTASRGFAVPLGNMATKPANPGFVVKDPPPFSSTSMP